MPRFQTLWELTAGIQLWLLWKRGWIFENDWHIFAWLRKQVLSAFRIGWQGKPPGSSVKGWNEQTASLKFHEDTVSSRSLAPNVEPHFSPCFSSGISCNFCIDEMQVWHEGHVFNIHRSQVVKDRAENFINRCPGSLPRPGNCSTSLRSPLVAPHADRRRWLRRGDAIGHLLGESLKKTAMKERTTGKGGGYSSY